MVHTGRAWAPLQKGCVHPPHVLSDSPGKEKWAAPQFSWIFFYYNLCQLWILGLKMLQFFIGKMLPCLKEHEIKIKAVPPGLLPAPVSLSLENIQDYQPHRLLNVQIQRSLVRGTIQGALSSHIFTLGWNVLLDTCPEWAVWVHGWKYWAGVLGLCCSRVWTHHPASQIPALPWLEKADASGAFLIVLWSLSLSEGFSQQNRLCSLREVWKRSVCNLLPTSPGILGKKQGKPA